MPAKRTLNSPEETAAFGKELAGSLESGDVVALFGELGAGKTTLLKSLISELCDLSPDAVGSPTFTYLHIYPGVYHFDLYRLRSSDDFTALGFGEYFDAPGICLLEWSERIEAILPKRAIRIHLSHAGGDARFVEVHR